MNFQFKKLLEKPILILIAFNLVVGLFIFRDYGLTWDEPLFYSYGKAVGYAYSPHEWLSGNFDLYNSYGASADDHKNRGPAYLFLSRGFVIALEAVGLDEASAWHLVNFLFFQLGIYFLYRTSKRWMSREAALLAAIFFSLQPLIWGHAFINPKDPPFLTFFLASICFGFEMVDAIAENAKNKNRKILLAAFFLGIATSIRILGPLAGLLVVLYSFSRNTIIQPQTGKSKFVQYIRTWFQKFFFPIFIFMIGSIVVMIATWPYLWESPIHNFIKVLVLMSDNPTRLSVLFGGVVYEAGELPRRYFPFMLATTLTEPTWPLFLTGLVYGYWKLRKEKRELVSISLMLGYFLFILAYIYLRHPSMYDGIRHFLFVIPAIFIFIGFTFQFILDSISWAWIRIGLVLLIFLPGVVGIYKLHPYEYAYYNSFIGGTSGAFRVYETEYWLTCYKETVEKINEATDDPVNLYVYREPYIAKYYADDNIQVFDYRTQRRNLKPNDYLLVNTRTNEDLPFFPNSPTVFEVSNGTAVFCVVKQIK